MSTIRLLEELKTMFPKFKLNDEIDNLVIETYDICPILGPGSVATNLSNIS